MSDPTPLLKFPPRLAPGDAISVVAPASSPDRIRYESSLTILSKAGYVVKTYRDLTQPRGYLSGTDEARVAEMNEALADPATKMVLAVRGGYGVGRILDEIDFSLLIDQPKIVCGYSDLTALHAGVQRYANLISIHGPNLIDGFGEVRHVVDDEKQAFHRLVDFDQPKSSEDFDLLQGADKSKLETYVVGEATGRLVGGNLAVLTALIGTKFEPDFKDGILFLEDIGEPLYRIDRMLTQLFQAGACDQLKGVVLGHFTDCQSEGAEQANRLKSLFESFFLPLHLPVLAGFPAGHEHPNLPLPMGALVHLNTKSQTLKIAQTW